MYRLSLIIGILAIPLIVMAGETHIGELILPTTVGGADPSCSTATADGDLCVGDDIETIDDIVVGDDLTVTGLASIGETLAMTGDVTLSGGAGGLTFSGSASSIVVDDNDATALLIGSSGALNLITLNTGTATESVIITGTTTVEAFKVDTGTATFDETVLVSGDLTLSGDAGGLTFDSNTSSIVIKDNEATGFTIGSAGHTNLITLNSGDDTESVIITGETAVEAFKVSVGTATFTEHVTATAGITSTNSMYVIEQADSDGTCVVGEWQLDTANTKELCYCQATNTQYCIVVDDATGPAD